MKRILTTILILVMAWPLFAQRPKVALVLCGGGAKGAAHVGVIKVLEEYDIPVDMVVGTSMGAIVGGMYAIGYNGNELDSMFMAQDWNYVMSGAIDRRQMSFDSKQVDDKLIFSVPFRTHELREGSVLDSMYYKSPENSGIKLPTSFINGQHIFSLFSDFTIGYHDYIDFNELPIPYACVAVDIISRKEVVFHEGQLSRAMRASMAIPGVFAPVRENDMLLIDGGFKNNFPVDVAKNMGADIVIGVKLGLNNPKELNYDSPVGVASAVLDVLTVGKNEEAYAATDILITPQIGDYGAMSFSSDALRDLIDYGEAAARNHCDELLALKRSLDSLDNNAPSRVAHDISKVVRDSLTLVSVNFEGIPVEEAEVLERIAEIKTGENILRNDISEAVRKYYETNAYASVSYRIDEDTFGKHLVIDCIPDKKNQVGLSVRADSEDVISALVDLRLNYRTLYGSQFNASGRISQNYAFNMAFSYRTKSIFEMSMAAGICKYQSKFDVDNSFNNLSYLQQNVEIFFSTNRLRNLKFKIGVELDKIKYLNASNYNYSVFVPDAYDTDMARDKFIHANFGFSFDNLDNRDFSTKGSLFDIKYANIYDMSSANTSFSTVCLEYSHFISAGNERKTTFMPFVKGRVTLGEKIPMAFMNMIGSNESSRYMEHQLSVFGLNAPVVLGKVVGVAGLDFRQQIGEKHFVSLGGNYVANGNSIGEALNNKGFCGVRLRYSYNLSLFPIALNLHWSTLTHKVGAYASIGYWF